MPDLINLYEYEAAAERNLTREEWDYVAGGATDEITLRRTRAAYDSIALRPRVLAGIGRADLSTSVLGMRLPVPFMLSPCGGHKRAHPDGELASARAAAEFGTVLGISANSSYPLEEIARAADGPRWFQTYFYRDRERTADMVKRGEESGYDAICVTLDSAWPSKRERNIRNTYKAGDRPNLSDADKAKLTNQTKFDAGLTSRSLVDPGATWEDVAWLRSRTQLPIVFKGVMTGEDASLCAKYGIDALIVSNHGARNLDTTLATVEALPEVVAGAAGKLEVYVDGGIRRGTDVVKALALGATAVMLGRPMFWGLAYAGDEGVVQVLDILRDEVESTMMLSGKETTSEISRDLVVRMPDLPTGF